MKRFLCLLLAACAPLCAARDYQFDGKLPRHVLESYLSRAITYSELLNGVGNPDDNIRMLKNGGVKFAGRSIYMWGGEERLADPAFLARGKELAARVHAADPDMVLQAAVFEIVSEGVERVRIPKWVFEEYSLKPEERNFRYKDMLFPDGRLVDHWRKGSSVPDVSRLETKLWFVFLSAAYIDIGVEAIHFGQIELVGRNDPGYRNWAEVIQRVRKYAAAHARRHYLISDAHVPGGGIVVDGNLILDFHSFPLRPKEIAGKPQQAELAAGFLDTIYGRSKGGRAPSGWYCDHLPYLVELDNFGRTRTGGQSSQATKPSAWTWGYDEISWFAHQPLDYRNQWLRYAWKRVRETDPNGYLQMPGSRTIADPVMDGGVRRNWYFANTRSEACPEGFSQEETIKAIWREDGGVKQPVDYVNPHIGGIAPLLQTTAPTVQLPYGMMRIAPIVTPGASDRYLADKIYGFPAAGAVLMPITGPVETNPERYASSYDHDFETATPYAYSVLLEKYNIQVDCTVSERAAYYRMAFPDGVASRLLFLAPQGGEISRAGETAVTGRGSVPAGAGRPGSPAFFYAEFSIAPSALEALSGLAVPRDIQAPQPGGSGLMAEFALKSGQRLGVRVGMSHISVEQARENLRREIASWNYEQAWANARGVWNRALSKVQIQGGTDQQRTIFYTALYRTMGRPINTEEYGQYFSPGDQKVHPAEGHGFYPASAGLWGSYRSLHPLQLILDPKRQVDYVRSFLALYDHTGRMMGAGRTSMIGHHVAGLVLDTYAKGHRDFDLAKAFEGLKKNAMEVTMLPWRDGPVTEIDRVYIEKGFFPALGKGEKESEPRVNPGEKRQAVGVTLEAAYDDWATAEVARILNRRDDYAYFLERAHNYRNVFDERTGFMAPKTADGKWKYEPAEFNPFWAGGQGGRDYYTEMNAWIYTFHVQQDIAGLARLMGGREALARKLDALFSSNPGGQYWKYRFMAQFPDMTGLMGQYAHGNEPSFHIPYMYNYVGEPWKTQRKVREILKTWYDETPQGISGDEDGGEESSWYVFSALGFYPVCPGRPVYDIGSPIFEEARITLENGNVFTISAPQASAENKYIQSARLNGQPLNRPWFEHKDLAAGGRLELDLGPRPNPSWGSAPNAAPPSMER